MATFDQLSADQRAILELVLRQGRSYEQLSEMLGMPESRVRELARDALVELAPVSAQRVDGEWRGQLSDYILGQQSGPESTATRGHLRRSEPARAWTRSLLDSLAGLYRDGELPSIPEPERGGRERRPRRERARGEASPPARPLSPEASSAVRRRRLIVGGGALAALILVAVLLWPIGLVTGGDDEEQAADGGAGREQARIVGQTVLRPVDGTEDDQSAGVAVITERDGQRQLVVQARLEPNEEGQAYEVWLFNNRNDVQSIGAQVTDQQGNYLGAGPLPENFEGYRSIDVSREPIDDDASHSGQSVLRGRLSAAGAGQGGG